MNIFYGIFYDGPQTVLIFTENKSIIDAVSKVDFSIVNCYEKFEYVDLDYI